MVKIPLEYSVIAILSGGKPIGTGFLVGPNLALTCAHVVTAAGSMPGGSLAVRFHVNNLATSAEVDLSAWSPEETEDIALLHLPGDAPTNAPPLELGSTLDCAGKPFFAFGYPVEAKELRGYPARGVITARRVIVELTGAEMLMLDSDQLQPGHSGSPVRDEQSGLVVGMLARRYPRQDEKKVPDWLRKVRLAVPAEILAARCGLPLAPPPAPVTPALHEEIKSLLGILKRKAFRPYDGEDAGDPTALFNAIVETRVELGKRGASYIAHPEVASRFESIFQELSVLEDKVRIQFPIVIDLAAEWQGKPLGTTSRINTVKAGMGEKAYHEAGALMRLEAQEASRLRDEIISILGKL
jgi:hypothetical protein